MDYKSEAEELQEQLDLLKKIIIFDQIVELETKNVKLRITV